MSATAAAGAAIPLAADDRDEIEVPPFPDGAPVRGVRPGEEMAHSAAVVAAIRARELRGARREFLKSLGLVLAVPVCAAGWFAWAKHPRIEHQIEFVPITENGVVVAANRWEALPPWVRADVATNTVWNYIRSREGFSHITADYGWRLVSVLSEKKIREEYQALNDPRNPESQTARYGEKTRVEIGYEAHEALCSTEVCRDIPEGYKFWFWRTEVMDGVRGRAVLHTASVRFHREVPGIDPNQRSTINAPGLQIWEYVPGTPAGAQTGAPRR